MSDDRFDYFAGTAGGSRGPSEFGTPPNQFGPPPNQFGPPPNQFGPPPQVWGAPVPGYPPAARRTGMPGWAIALIAIVGTIVVLTVFAVAIPAFLAQRDKAVADATTVALPLEVAGMPQRPDAPIQQLQQMMNTASLCSCFGTPVAAIYGAKDNSHFVTVIASKFTVPAHSGDRDAVVDAWWKGVQAGAAGRLTLGDLASEDAGSLGGRMSCAPITSGVTGRICAAVDAGSFVSVYDLYRGAPVDAQLPIKVRELVVHRS